MSQPHNLPFYDLIVPNPRISESSFFPVIGENIRCCIVGLSFSGKTNSMMNFLLVPGYLNYDNLFICTTTLYQPTYQTLLKAFENEGSSKIEPHETIPDPSVLDPKKRNLIIFDDLLIEKNQSIIEAYYIKGRHNNVDCFYLAQDFFKIPKNTIRENSNLFIIFRQDKSFIDWFKNEHCHTIEKEEFVNLCHTAWEEPHRFVMVQPHKSYTIQKVNKIG